MFTTQGAIEAQWGQEGTGWATPTSSDVALDPTEKPLYKVLPTDQKNPLSYNGAWGAVTQYASTTAFRNAQVEPMDVYSVDGYERRLYDATKLYDGKEDMSAVFKWWTYWVPQAESSQLATVQTNVENYIQTQSAEFITGTRDPNSDSDWQTYLSGLNNIGGPTYVKIWQDAMDAASNG